MKAGTLAPLLVSRVIFVILLRVELFRESRGQLFSFFDRAVIFGFNLTFLAVYHCRVTFLRNVQAALLAVMPIMLVTKFSFL